MFEQKNLEIKLAVVGDRCVGKTSIIERYLNGTFNESSCQTREAVKNNKQLTVNDKPVNIKIWDTVTLQMFKRPSPNYYREVQGVIIVYDISNQSTFDNTVTRYIIDARRFAHPEIPIILVGNKSDVGKIREVEFKCGKQYAESNMISFLETSAKDGSGVDKAFLKILSIISSEFQYEEEIQYEEEPTVDSTYSYCTCL